SLRCLGMAMIHSLEFGLGMKISELLQEMLSLR
ncbi:hypothetical protein A2U01_0115448, partial [Trifolium medium]|nr:hypothetical protein [Trifolium medium]